MTTTSSTAPWGGDRAGRQVEPRAFTELEVPKAKDADGHSHGELARARGPGHLDPGETGTPDLRLEDARVEPLQADASPPETGEGQGRCEKRRAAIPGDERRKRESSRDDGDGRVGFARDESESEPRADGRRQSVRGGHAPGEIQIRPASWIRPHRSTSGRSCSSRAGPIPGTASSSSTERKTPFASR